MNAILPFSTSYICEAAFSSTNASITTKELGRRHESMLVNHSTTKEAHNEGKTVTNFTLRLDFL